MTTFYFAEYESRSWTFRAIGKTRSDAHQSLLKGLRAHTEQFELCDDWFYPDDINVQPMGIGTAYRDHCEI